MVIKTRETVENILYKVFNSNRYGTPIYHSKIEESSLFMVFEEYTLRNGNYMTISIVIEDKENSRYIHHIQAGSSRGFLGFDWGAGSSRTRRLISILDTQEISYEIISE